MNTATMLDNTNTLFEPAQTFCLVVDGNSHAPELLSVNLPQQHFLISEALLPLIRTIAMLIAAKRLDFTGRLGSDITEEADWFAARMLVLKIKNFHLDVSLLPMLQTANDRADEFAKIHHIPFKPAQMKMSLHANRPNNALLLEMSLGGLNEDLGLVANSLALKEQVSLQSHFCHLV